MFEKNYKKLLTKGSASAIMHDTIKGMGDVNPAYNNSDHTPVTYGSGVFYCFRGKMILSENKHKHNKELQNSTRNRKNN